MDLGVVAGTCFEYLKKKFEHSRGVHPPSISMSYYANGIFKLKFGQLSVRTSGLESPSSYKGKAVGIGIYIMYMEQIGQPLPKISTLHFCIYLFVYCLSSDMEINKCL